MENNILSNKDFICDNCKKSVKTSNLIGTKNRNHCPSCLWSKHVDLKISGDRKAKCNFLMKPIGLTFKKVKTDKYATYKLGELMLIHVCTNKKCGKISINRIAGDDDEKSILKVFKKSFSLKQKVEENLRNEGIDVLKEADEKQVNKALFGN
jgi:hypothetical protein